MLRVRAGELFPVVRLWRTRATGVAAHERLATPFLRAWCRVTRRRVVVWTVDDDAGLSRWLTAGVAVVTTNRPRRALERRA